MDFYINEETAWFRRGVRWVVNVVVVLACAWFAVYGFCGQVRILGNSMQPVLDGEDAVQEGLINSLGSLSDALDCLYGMIDKAKKASEKKQVRKGAKSSKK